MEAKIKELAVKVDVLAWAPGRGGEIPVGEVVEGGFVYEES